MNKMILFVLLIFSSITIIGQSDSLLLVKEANRNYVEEFIDIKPRILLPNIDALIDQNCNEEALYLLVKKAESARENMTINGEHTILLLLDSLLLKYAFKLSEKSKNSLVISNLEAWLSFNQRTGHHLKTIEKFKFIKSTFFLNANDFPDIILKSLERSFRLVGTEYLNKNEYVIAISYFQDAYNISSQISLKKSRISRSSLNRGYITNIYLLMNKLPDSLGYFYDHLKNAYDLYNLKGSDVDHLITAYRRLTDVHIINENLDSASFYLDKIENLESKHSKATIKSSFIKARILLQLKKNEKAKRLLSKLFYRISSENHLSKTINFNSNFTLANLLIEAEMYPQAEDQLNFLAANIKENVGSDKIENFNLFSKENREIEILMSQLKLGSYYTSGVDTKKIMVAFKILEEKMESAITRDAKLNYALKSAELTEHFLNFNKNQGKEKLEDLYISIESSKAATSRQSWLQNQLTTFGESYDVFSLEEECEFKLESLDNTLSNSIDSLEKENIKMEINHYISMLNSIKEILKEKHPDYYKMKYNWTIPSLSDVQNSLSKNEVLINYYEGKDFLYAMVSSIDSSQLFTIGSSQTINNLVSKFSEHIHQDKRIGHTTDSTLLFSNLLYQKIIEPINEYFKSKIIISPSGSLFELPFAALNINSDIVNFDSKKDYLLYTQAISITPSASFFYELRNINESPIIQKALFVAPSFAKRQQPKNLLTLPTELDSLEYNVPDVKSISRNVNNKTLINEFLPKDLLVMRSELDSLEYNVSEVKSISRYLNSKMLINEFATKDTSLKYMSDMDLIHLATHAKSNSDAPEKSFVAFHKSNGDIKDEDYKWYLHEISKLRLNAKMIVLSACETGLGEFIKGEGAMSLANSCFYAGAHSVVANLWRAEDKASSELMESYYFYLDKGLLKDESLQLAQKDYLSIRSGYKSNPFFWAGFSVMGSTQALEFKKTPNYRNWVLIIFSVIAFIIFYPELKKIFHQNQPS